MQIDFVGTELTPMVDTDGQRNKRYFMAHRVSARLAGSLRLAIWETAVLAGPGPIVRRRPSGTRSSPSPFPLQLGLTDDRNVLLGGDLSWRPGGVLLQAQAAIDDRWRSKADPSGTGEPAHPGRWALTVSGAGRLGPGALWQASVAVVSSLAFRTGDSAQSLIDRGVGLGPNFTDNALLTASVAVPVAGSWMIQPDLALLRQGEGRIDAPFPTGAALTDTPELFIGTAATTYRLGTSLSGRRGALALQGSAGLQHTVNADHVAGRHRTRVEARITATIGLDVGGALK